VVQAHLAAQATKGRESQQRRRKQKFALMTMMYERGYSRQEVINLFRFIEWVMILPPELEKAFKNDLATYEEEKNMTYVTSFERMGMANLVIRQLSRRVGNISQATSEQVEQLSADRLEKLGEDLLDFTGSKDLANWLQQYGD
jgi:hypothetical protein